jgi:hypothetical protein
LEEQGAETSVGDKGAASTVVVCVVVLQYVRVPAAEERQPLFGGETGVQGGNPVSHHGIVVVVVIVAKRTARGGASFGAVVVVSLYHHPHHAWGFAARVRVHACCWLIEL